jgi:hypothetical protein
VDGGETSHFWVAGRMSLGVPLDIAHRIEILWNSKSWTNGEDEDEVSQIFSKKKILNIFGILA